MRSKFFSKAACMVALVSLVGQTLPAADVVTLNGAGATFPYPIYSKWFDEYHKANPNVEINYQSIGSGGGIKQVTAKTVDFGASDGPMNDEQLFAVDGKLLHIPTVAGAVVMIYNIPGFSGKLKFTGSVIADIYLGKIKKWSDPAIASLNPDAKLPDSDIVVVHRSDGSGTSYCFTDYLSKVSDAWKSKVGKGTSVNWPVGLGEKGNEGVSGTVKQTPNGFGYVELIYAIQNNTSYGLVQNQAGKFVEASLESVTAAAAGAAQHMPRDFRVSITNAPGDDVYPISTFTWLLIYQKNSGQKGQIIKDFLDWMLEKGQSMTQDLGYAPLPDTVKQMVKETITQIK